MKRLFTMLLICMMILGLFAGCGDNNKPIEPSKQVQAEDTQNPE